MAKLKGVILAAGLGTRLRPLTDETPKPLLPFCGVPIFYLAMAKLIRAGVTEIAANTHYLANKVERAARGNPFGVPVHISDESQKILGSGGVYGQLHQFRRGSSLLAVNGDVVSNFELEPLIAEFERRKPWVALGLVKGQNPIGNSIWIDESGRVVDICVQRPNTKGQISPHIFSGFQLLSDMALAEFPPNQEGDLIATFRRGLTQGKEIIGLHQDCFWHDLGTPATYFAAHMEYLKDFDERAVSQGEDALGLGFSLRALGIPFRFFSETHSDGKVHLIGPSLLCGKFELPPGSRIGPNVVMTSPVSFSCGVIFSDALIAECLEVDSTKSLSGALYYKQHYSLIT
jgi:NDP-sugar pyrophosphorylase family protein